MAIINDTIIDAGIDTSDATAVAGNILKDKTAYINGEKIIGTMANQGAKTASLNAGGSYTIPAGYHDGNGKITANSLASQTDGTATAAQILNGQTAYVDGTKVTGTMIDQGAQAVALTFGNSYTIPAGYHNGSGTVSVQALPTLSSAAGSGQILSGYQAIDQNGNIISGTATRAKTSAAITYQGSYIDIYDLSFNGTKLSFRAMTYQRSYQLVEITLS